MRRNLFLAAQLASLVLLGAGCAGPPPKPSPPASAPAAQTAPVIPPEAKNIPLPTPHK